MKTVKQKKKQHYCSFSLVIGTFSCKFYTIIVDYVALRIEDLDTTKLDCSNGFLSSFTGF